MCDKRIEVDSTVFEVQVVVANDCNNELKKRELDKHSEKDDEKDEKPVQNY